jgi:hypothetical protein
MVRRSVLAMFAVMAIVFGCVVVSAPAGAVVDSATIVPSPNVGNVDDELWSVSCVSASECVAVGFTNTQFGYRSLTMVWDGTEWSVPSSPNVSAPTNLLASVSCLSVSECVAVGYTSAGGVSETLTMVWDGAEWSIVSSPNVSAPSNWLTSVSCVSVSECVAVGYTDTGNNVYETLVMMWDGAEWSIVSSPNAGTRNDELYSVSCVSMSKCVAVGYVDTGNYVYETLVLAWDGTEWSIVSSPNAGTSDDELYSVSCVSVSECVAVGYTFTGSAYETLVLVWDGAEWSVVSSANAGTSGDRLESVSCVSASECVAVGYSDTGSAYETLVLVWDGAEWSIVPSPNPGSDYNGDRLKSVSCASSWDCVAVGYTYTGSAYETLALSLTGPVPPSTTTTAVSPLTTTTLSSSDQLVPEFAG